LVDAPAKASRLLLPLAGRFGTCAEQMTEKAEAAKRVREAGDRYLRDAADYQSALRCYRHFLDGADAADLVVSPSDSWLLTSLKRAREQENVQ
jgi:hypothetical protein